MQSVTQAKIGCMFQAAIQRGAADILMDVIGDTSSVYFTIDGERRLYETLTEGEGAALISSVLNLSSDDIDSSSGWRHGRMTPPANVARELASVHTAHVPLHGTGQALLLRLQYVNVPKARGDDLPLPSGPDGQSQFEALGFTAEQVRTLDTIQRVRGGLIVITGPTGSGLTTTSYELLRELQRREPDGRIVTVEPAPNLTLPGTLQLAVGLHPEAMRRSASSALRLSPTTFFCDIDECGDWLAIESAFGMALTGHRSIMTAYSSSVEAMIEQMTRALQQSAIAFSHADPKESVAAVLKGIINQRLVRTLCPHCSVPLDRSTFGQGTGSGDRRVLEALATHGDLSGVRVAGSGCTQCSGSGHGSRLMIADVFSADDIAGLLTGRSPAAPSIAQRIVALVLSGRVSPPAACEVAGIAPR